MYRTGRTPPGGVDKSRHTHTLARSRASMPFVHIAWYVATTTMIDDDDDDDSDDDDATRKRAKKESMERLTMRIE